MLVGYARTSTLEQDAGLNAQVRDLRDHGCETIYKEQVSSVGEREQLDAAIKSLRSGDKLVVCKLDRLARSVRHLGDLLETLEDTDAGLVILSMGGQQVDTSTATGKMMLNVMASVAQFEREMMLERQREGIAKARAEGKYTGRKPTAMAKADSVKALLATGMSKAKVCEQVGISRASLYRILAN
ncbi:recombinase family protein [Marivita geojedonensis]|uniref:DNA invertase n=1 Tax=Marivita geojedonensis TaxID=1123756 RepID=A0A1X4NFD8_9RHOB|nr:recombinase family protein [Marivita geojedonensis]OSQ45728.1 DNA invertase [Marivita geojedonensis]PRY74057.1 DNA invertase Pin-like site-specific DNA recombinase [Marivita geojedonensis]